MNFKHIFKPGCGRCSSTRHSFRRNILNFQQILRQCTASTCSPAEVWTGSLLFGLCWAFSCTTSSKCLAPASVSVEKLFNFHLTILWFYFSDYYLILILCQAKQFLMITNKAQNSKIKHRSFFQLDFKYNFFLKRFIYHYNIFKDKSLFKWTLKL